MEADLRQQAALNSQECEMLRPPNAGVPEVTILCRRLLAWYDSNQRDLPWRRSADPYRIWLSEIMLQQTRVAAVLQHYKAFLARFPTVRKLAAAPLESVLAAWSGLGYYRRARSLHRAAQQIVECHGSRIPRTMQELRALPGVGRYTGAAVASIAFGVPVAVVDGNVERVISRLLSTSSAGSPAVSTLDYWALAESLLARRRPGDWNQAMMELGATVCLPRQPQCGACPLKRWCKSSPRAWSQARPALAVARAESADGRDEIARTGSVVPRRKFHKDEAYLLAQRSGSVYLVRRALRAKVMAGMWELPRLLAPPSGREPLFRLKHSITVTNYEIAVFDDAGKPRGGRWVAFDQIPELPLTGLARKVLRRAKLI
jgi:A/G-specific adenine glycosylase